jgi:glycosyltransferase involved in cell wall biosynthesis
MRVALMLESDGPGGAETMLLVLAQELRALGLEVVPVGPRQGIGWLAEEFRRLGFEPETFHLRGALDPVGALTLARTLRRREVDVIHSHEFTMAVYGGLVARLLRRPHVITMHGGTYFAGAGRRRMALRWAMRHARCTVGVSSDTARRLESLLGLPDATVQVIPNGRRLARGSGSRVRGELGLSEGQPLVVCVGNLYPVKGHEFLVRALAELVGAGQDQGVVVAIAGRGDEGLAALGALATNLGLGDRVRLLGHRDDVADLLDAADVFAMPSLSEGLPLAILEAMAAGTPILASEVGGIPEAVRNEEEGLLVPPGDPEALARELARLLENADMRRELGERAQRRAARISSPEGMAAAYAELYRDPGSGP